MSDRDPGLYITIRLDSVRKVYDPHGFGSQRFSVETETLCDATEQNFSPFVMAAFLRALADEVDGKRTDSPRF